VAELNPAAVASSRVIVWIGEGESNVVLRIREPTTVTSVASASSVFDGKGGVGGVGGIAGDGGVIDAGVVGAPAFESGAESGSGAARLGNESKNTIRQVRNLRYFLISTTLGFAVLVNTLFLDIWYSPYAMNCLTAIR
jgi:hypothetical protein